MVNKEKKSVGLERFLCVVLPDLTRCVLDSWSDRTPLHEAAYQGRLLHLRSLIAQVNVTQAHTLSS